MGLAFPKQDRPAEFNYITFPIPAIALPDVSDAQALPLSFHSRCLIEQAASAASSSRPFPELQGSRPKGRGCTSRCWLEVREGVWTDAADLLYPPRCCCFKTSAAAVLLINQAGSL